MKKLILYIHGKGGSAGEAERYRALFPDCHVAGLAYTAQTPWEAVKEFPRLLDTLAEGHASVTLIANSIGAYFAMNALADKTIEKAYFISPVVDMEQLITDMMGWAGVTPAQLEEKGKIETAFGETLSWEYLRYVREHPIRWTVPTEILYGGRDDLTSRETVTRFAARIGAGLTVMEQGEHWFHTPEQLAFLDGWLTRG